MRVESDICIIGGGPAGSVLGARLAQFGFEVCLVERAQFPRRRLGESLTPGVLPLLDSIGARAAIEDAEFPRVHRVGVRWEGPRRREREDPQGRGRLADRGEFDLRLLEHARRCGVRVFQPATVESLENRAPGWSATISESGRTTELRVRFVVDASGRGGCRLLPRRREATGRRTLALHGYWTGEGLPTEPSIEAGEAEWFWGVPLPGGLYNTLVFVDPRDLRAMPGTLSEKFSELLSRSSLLPRDAEAALSGEVCASDATPFLDRDCIGEDFLKVGDAALALDPISSSGVQKAIQGALSAAVVVHTILRRPHSSELARDFYRERLEETSRRHRAWAGENYASVATGRSASEFWQSRSAREPDSLPDRERLSDGSPSPRLRSDTPIRVVDDVEIVQQACLSERFVEQRPAVRVAGMEEPIVFLGGVEVIRLLCEVRPGMTLEALAMAWRRLVAPAQVRQVAEWLLAQGLLETATEAALGYERSQA